MLKLVPALETLPPNMVAWELDPIPIEELEALRQIIQPEPPVTQQVGE